jgi:hypothetical protein
VLRVARTGKKSGRCFIDQRFIDPQTPHLTSDAGFHNNPWRSPYGAATSPHLPFMNGGVRANCAMDVQSRREPRTGTTQIVTGLVGRKLIYCQSS